MTETPVRPNLAEPAAPEPSPRSGVRNQTLFLVIVGILAIAVAVVLWQRNSWLNDADYIEWHRVRASNVVESGPGGFVRINNGNVNFSPDGVRWARAVLPKAESDPPPDGAIWRSLEITSSNDLWFVTTGFGSGFAWTSPDGMSWARAARLPEALRVVGAGVGLIAELEDGYIWSADGNRWTQTDPPSAEAFADGWRISGTTKGAALVGVDIGTLDVAITTNGTNWSVASIGAGDFGLSLGQASVFQVDETWILTVRDHVKGFRVWTSPDGVEWTDRGFPTFANRTDTFPHDDIEHLGTQPAVSIRVHRSNALEVWTTQDGTTWERALTRSNVRSVAAIEDAEGNFTAVYAGSSK